MIHNTKRANTTPLERRTQRKLKVLIAKHRRMARDDRNVVSLLSENLKLREQLAGSVHLSVELRHAQRRYENAEAKCDELQSRVRELEAELEQHKALLHAADVERTVMIKPLRKECEELRNQVMHEHREYIRQFEAACWLSRRQGDLTRVLGNMEDWMASLAANNEVLRINNDILFKTAQMNSQFGTQLLEEKQRVEDMRKVMEFVLDAADKLKAHFTDCITLEVDADAERVLLSCGHAFNPDSLIRFGCRMTAAGGGGMFRFNARAQCPSCRATIRVGELAYPCFELRSATRDAVALHARIQQLMFGYPYEGGR